MSRIAKIDVADWDADLREFTHGEALPPVARSVLNILAHRPTVAKAFVSLFGAFKTDQTLPDRLIELVRLRMAFHNQCRTCMAIRYQDPINDGLTEDLVCSLEKPMESPGLSDAQRAALAYTDRFCTDHLSIDDTHMNALREYFSEGQLVELNVWLAMGGFSKMAAVFDMVEDLPEHFQDKSVDKIAPWSSPHIVVQ
jgi:alkylhydroperoxidase family enzyme